MASINYAAREINVKIVYYGPGLSGKTTNLQVIHRKVPPEFKSDMVSLATETDRTLFFDFLPLDLGKIKGFATKFQLYTVPGQVYYNATRKLVLRGVDGVVFVADSGQDKIEENLESFQNLEDNLAEYGYKRENIPIIIQYNKRDLPNALSVDELHQYVNKYNLPWSEAIANKGVGVFDSLKLIGKIVIDYLNKKYSRGGSRGQAAPAAPQGMPQQQQQRPPVRPAPTMSGAPYQQPATPGYNQLGQQPPPRPSQFPSAGMAPQPPRGMQPQQQMRSPALPQSQMPMNKPAGIRPPQQPQRPQQPYTPSQQFQSNPALQQQQGAFDMESIQQQRPVRPAPRAPMPPPAAAPIDDFQEQHATFEPPAPAAPMQQMPGQQEEYYSYGSINLEPLTNQQQNAMAGSNEGYASFDQAAVPPPLQPEFDPSGGKTDLDLEIERYQREIEDKQRRGGNRGQAPAQQQSAYMPPPQQQQQPAPQYNAQPPAGTHQDYDVYNMEPQSFGAQPQQTAQPMLGANDEEEMFFTSVDTDRQKKPIKRPINPRTTQQQQPQQQKGFLSKFFNKDMPG